MNRFPFVLLAVLGASALGQNVTPPVTGLGDVPAPQNETQKWLATADAQWQSIYARDVIGPFETDAARLRQQYLATIDANINKSTNAGNLDLTLMWKKERDRFVAAKDVPAEDDAADPMAVKEARAIIRTQVARLEKDRAIRARSAYDRYDQVLAQAQIQLTQRRRIDDALLVKAKREEIAAAWLGNGAAHPTKTTDEGNPAGKTGAPTPSGAEKSSTDALEKLFVGKTWQSPAGTTFTFAQDGTCVREANQKKESGNWERIDARVVKASGKTPQEDRYFRFISESEAYYGRTIEEMTTRIHRR